MTAFDHAHLRKQMNFIDICNADKKKTAKSEREKGKQRKHTPYGTVLYQEFFYWVLESLLLCKYLFFLN